MEAALSSHALNTIAIDRQSRTPIYQQLCAQFRDLIEGRRLVAGVRLPSSRDLSQELGVSRKTVVDTYDQLMAEGYIRGKQGAGTFVEPLPEIDSLTESITSPASFENTSAERPPNSGRLLAPSMPDMEHFPRTAWAKAAARAQRHLDLDSMFNGTSTGYAPLRKAIAEHLRAMRGLVCHPHQVIVTSGLIESIGLIGNSILAPGDRVLTEDPGCTKTSWSLNGTSTRAARVSVDADGLDVESALSSYADAKAVIVTPSRQFPLGVQLSLPRRVALINWAQSTEGWIVEDDYDCEYRFSGRPLQSMYSMDKSRRTIYLGSLSKVLFPQLRISFIVAPDDAAAKLAEYQDRIGSLASMLTQAALCEFMNSGQFSTHLRQMRRLYKKRYDYVYRAVDGALGEFVDAQPIGGGTQFAVFFKKPLRRGKTDRDVVEEVNGAGLGLYPLSMFYGDAPAARQGLVIGFASTSTEDADRGISILKRVLKAAV